ncbi:MAG: hypothetical protein ACQEP5_10040 [Actinomycetota bacterium]
MKILVTIFSIIIILFGLCGAVFASGSIRILHSHQQDFDHVHKLSLSVSSSLEEIIEMLKNSNESTDNIAETVRTTKDTLSYTSEITNNSGEAFNEVAGMVGFEIMGFKPLEGAENYFTDIGNNMFGLSRELELVQDNLEINASDIDRIGVDLADISVELEDVSTQFNQILDTYDIHGLVSILNYVLIYLGILNIIFILIGTMFLLMARRIAIK